MTLYEINDSIRATLEALYNSVDDDGVIDDNTAETLDTLMIERDTKIENIALYIKELNAEAEAIKAEAAKLTKRAKAAENKAERLKNYLSVNLLSNGERNFTTARCKIGFRSSNAVTITDEAAIPKKYITKKITTAPDKKAIKEALEAGRTVKGAALEAHENIQIK